MKITRYSSTDSFINEAIKIHKNNYKYNEAECSKSTSMVRIICKKHGIFVQKAIFHLSGSGCPECGLEKISKSKRYTKQQFIDKSNKIHNNKYDYSKVRYTNSNKEVLIICPIHGEFKQKPIIHFNGSQCQQCDKEDKKIRNLLTGETFLKKVKKFNNKYTYRDLTLPQGRLTILRYTCPIHGEIQQKAYQHTRNGCPKCSRDIVSENQRIGKQSFIDRSNIIHNNKYDYSAVSFTDIKDKSWIICPTHGKFHQQIAGHLQGSGCPKCSRTFSSYEQKIEDFLKSQNIEYKNQVKINQIASTSSNLEIDFYLPAYQIGIEVNGILWHSELFNRDKKYHLNKTQLCKEQGIQLVHIFTHLMDHKLDLVFSRLSSIIGINSKKVFARKCKITQITSKQSKKFLNTNHLQGNVNASIRYGLFSDDELVSVMTFSKTRKSLGHITKDCYELLRFCTKDNTTIVGGASKLLKQFLRDYNPTQLITYADKCWSDGEFYKKIGFTYDHSSAPGYWYFKNNEVYHRYKFAKHTLKDQLDIFDPNLTEWENMQANGYNRFWDCGNFVFKYK